MRETLRVRRHEVVGKPLQHTEKGGAHTPSFARRFLLKCEHMSRPVSLVIHPEHVEYVLGCSDGGTRADRKPNGTYITNVNKGDKQR
jgi:hypothetical protein